MLHPKQPSGNVVNHPVLPSHSNRLVLAYSQVYDGTPFLKNHPGGADSILIVAGQDASDEFDAIHSSKAKAQLEDYYIGELAEEGAGEGLRMTREAHFLARYPPRQPGCLRNAL